MIVSVVHVALVTWIGALGFSHVKLPSSICTLVDVGKSHYESRQPVSLGEKFHAVAESIYLVLGFVRAYVVASYQQWRTRKQSSSSSVYAQVVSIIDNQHIKITYEYKGNMYHMIQRVHSHPTLTQFMHAHGCKLKPSASDSTDMTRVGTVNEEWLDISSEIRGHVGPLEDWHNVTITPTLLGYSAIRIARFDPDTLDIVEKTYSAQEVMQSIQNMQ